ncbi:hypothetical protein [Stigmatella aurantiaca]|uniref:Conserved uncharacterized protein n=1 Tax=Stigmatella aurantiaca (strain DW4/3-1) TaxID=378806 RepID=Q09B40_STIAD|nr:hypothetical protein [Stigmatella aurantiaca]ADO69203.1 conserved uncharacterized protein [Stigmatella aurantiaca DW4/3-1]EAU68995.1 hypothetical protein STIAU_0338 [Stigmatella aurantiaca DW4/3-1]
MESPASRSCPRCGAPRAPAPECPQCGVYYFKAEARAAPVHRAAQTEEPAPLMETPAFPTTQPWVWKGDAEDALREVIIRAFALPTALLLMWLICSSGVGRMLVRTFLSMWLHELGHAATAWLCGYTAFPMPWFTSVSPARSPFFSVLLAGAFGLLAYRGWKRSHRPMLIAGLVLLCLQFIGTVVVRSHGARALITFGGDGGGMILGTLLMATLYSQKGSSLHEGWLRWGFLVIGAASFVDIFMVWRDARNNFGSIPFGQNEGSGASDPSVLSDTFGWSVNTMVARYMNLAWTCLAVLGGLYALGLYRARRGLVRLNVIPGGAGVDGP